MTNPELKNYWRGYRCAIEDILYVGIEAAKEQFSIQDETQYAKGYNDAIREQEKQLIKFMKKNKEREKE